MINIRLIRENADAVRKNYGRRQDERLIKLLDETIELDKVWREAKYAADQLMATKNAITVDIAKLKREGKDAKAKFDEMKLLPKRLEDLKAKEAKYKAQLDACMMRLPNLLADDVPYGKDDTENVVIRSFGKPQQPSFDLMPHAEVAESLGGADFERATKIAGAGFYFLQGEIALLNQALIRYAIDALTKKGYSFIEPPLLMNHRSYAGVTDLGDFGSVMYKVEGEDLYLIATSEHPLIAMWQDEVIPEERLPIKLVCVSPCFRKEVGAHGIDERGLFRRHQFWKVEQIILCKPQDSPRFHEEMIRNTEDLWQGISIPYQVVNICTGDIGTVAAKKYDINAWMPRAGVFKEVVSGSNCTDYQARRLNIKFGKEGGKKELVHTLNCTAIATSRALVAILENFQGKDGSVAIPAKLQSYMGKKKKIRGA
ncbi:serine--tRNA ligase [Candidatus Woesearchaeota archaeon]|nr:serine--tRNA ligase [Candidatus Woesearchaeota archaeon]